MDGHRRANLAQRKRMADVVQYEKVMDYGIR